MGFARVDFREFKEFQKKLKKLEKDQLEEFVRDCSRELAARLLAKVIKRTPVGKKPKLEGPKSIKLVGKNGKKRAFLTKEAARIQNYWGDYQGGTLRRGWTGGTNENARTFANSLSVTKSGNEYHIEIVNPIHYASYYEFGHRQTPGRFVPALGKRLKEGWVPGHFVLTKSEIELERQMPGILEKKLMKFLGEAFND